MSWMICLSSFTKPLAMGLPDLFGYRKGHRSRLAGRDLICQPAAVVGRRPSGKSRINLPAVIIAGLTSASLVQASGMVTYGVGLSERNDAGLVSIASYAN